MKSESFIPGKDASLEATIRTLRRKLAARGFHLNESSWLNPVKGVWSVHVREHECPMLFANGKGATKLAARASALGEFFERLSTHYFWTHFYLGATRANRPFVHYPQERWFAPAEDARWPVELLNPELHAFYNPEGEIDGQVLVDLNSGNVERGICALPYTRLRDGARTWIPVNIIGNLYVSNGMSAGNTLMEARTQALAEIFERHIKFRIIKEALCLPEVPDHVIARYPGIAAGIKGLREAGFGILVRDASLGGRYPVMNVTLLHPKDQGCFASFGAHPRFEIALQRALTELLQGRALKSLEGFPEPGFDMDEIALPSNLEIHFVDSSGVISWDFLGDTPDYPFCDWNFSATTAEDYAWLCDCIHAEGKDIYVADFTEQCRKAGGDHEHWRVTDREWGRRSGPHKRRLAYQTFHGIRDILGPLVIEGVGVAVPMQDPGKGKMLLLESAPAATLRRARIAPPFKGAAPLAWRARNGVLEAFERLGRLVKVEEPLRERVLQDPEGDSLAAVIAAITAAYASAHRERWNDDPTGGYAIEGRIFGE